MDPVLQTQPEQAPPSTPPVPPEKKISKKLIIAATILIVLLLILGIGGYFLNLRYQASLIPPVTIDPSSTPTSTPDPTKNWKTYTDSTYGFSVQYPPTWIVNEYEDGVGFSSNPNNPQSNESFGDGVSMQFHANPNNITTLDFVKTIRFKEDLPPWKNTERAKATTFNGLDATKVEDVVGGKGGFGSGFFISYESTIIELLTQNPSDTNEKIFNTMLSTFKFTP